MFTAIKRAIALQWLLNGRPVLTRLRRSLTPLPDISDLLPDASEITTPQAIADHLTGRLRWVSDELWGLVDWTPWPEAVYVARKDDCDGFAAVFLMFMQRFLDRTQYRKCQMLAIATEDIKSSHFVAVWQQDSGFYLATNYRRPDGSDAVRIDGPWSTDAKFLTAMRTWLGPALLLVWMDENINVTRVEK